jgi:hypothetical protein
MQTICKEYWALGARQSAKPGPSESIQRDLSEGREGFREGKVQSNKLQGECCTGTGFRALNLLSTSIRVEWQNRLKILYSCCVVSVVFTLRTAIDHN